MLQCSYSLQISDRQIIPLNAYELKAELKARGTKISFTREEFQNLAQKQDVLRESEEKLVVLSTAVEQKLREKREYFDFVSNPVAKFAYFCR